MNQSVAIIGGGLSGTLLAVLLAERGLNVELYERRPDLRTSKISAGRSINLALSSRGIKALKHIGMDEYILKEVVPMKGRMIHPVEGNLSLLPYSGREHLHINSVSRGGLNKALLSKADEYSNIKIHFNTKCNKVDFKNKLVHFTNESTGEDFTSNVFPIIGSDGSASAVRDSMMSGIIRRFNYSQSFLAHGYKELNIEPNADGSFKMEKNALHIWPRGAFMLIALPNFDGTFTCTLFLPYEGADGLDNLNSQDKVHNFFKKYFPDLFKYIPNIEEQFLNNPASTLATIKCHPWNVSGDSLLIGDAAHAVVPFYGQGMNASFEDCLEFCQILDSKKTDENYDWRNTFKEFSDVRKINADSIADLAVENYYEMSSAVANPTSVKKRYLETQLEKNFAEFNSKYSMVTFCDHLSYSYAKELGFKQEEYLMNLCSKIEDVEKLDIQLVFNDLEKLKSDLK